SPDSISRKSCALVLRVPVSDLLHAGYLVPACGDMSVLGSRPPVVVRHCCDEEHVALQGWWVQSPSVASTVDAPPSARTPTRARCSPVPVCAAVSCTVQKPDGTFRKAA